MYLSAISLVKISILILYLRIIARTYAKLKYAIWGVMGVVICAWISTLIAAIAQCPDPAVVFSRTGPGNCRTLGQIWLAMGVVNIVTDVFILILPIPVIVRLKAPVWQKLGIILLMSTGIL